MVRQLYVYSLIYVALILEIFLLIDVIDDDSLATVPHWTASSASNPNLLAHSFIEVALCVFLLMF